MEEIENEIAILGKPITVYFNNESKVIRRDGKGIAINNNCFFFIDNFKKSMQIIPIHRIIRIIVDINIKVC